jgi:hypothetical protein
VSWGRIRTEDRDRKISNIIRAAFNVPDPSVPSAMRLKSRSALRGLWLLAEAFLESGVEYESMQDEQISRVRAVWRWFSTHSVVSLEHPEPFNLSLLGRFEV